MRACIFRLIACIMLPGFAGLSTVTALAQEELFNYRQMRSSMPADTGGLRVVLRAQSLVLADAPA